MSLTFGHSEKHLLVSSLDSSPSAHRWVRSGTSKYMFRYLVGIYEKGLYTREDEFWIFFYYYSLQHIYRYLSIIVIFLASTGTCTGNREQIDLRASRARVSPIESACDPPEMGLAQNG